MSLGIVEDALETQYADGRSQPGIGGEEFLAVGIEVCQADIGIAGHASEAAHDGACHYAQHMGAVIL